MRAVVASFVVLISLLIPRCQCFTAEDLPFRRKIRSATTPAFPLISVSARHVSKNAAPNASTRSRIFLTATDSDDGSADDGCFSFRPATNDDFDLVQRLMNQKRAFTRALQQTSEADFLKENAKLDNTQLQSLFPEVPNGTVLLVYGDNLEIVGFALYALRYAGLSTPPVLFLDRLFVDPSRRSQGAGTATMKELASISVALACSHVAWQVDARNQRGVDFYVRRIGAEIVNESGTDISMKWLPPTPPEQ